MSASRPSPITGLCGRSAAQSYNKGTERTNFLLTIYQILTLGFLFEANTFRSWPKQE